MMITVDLATGEVGLDTPDDCTAFAVAVSGAIGTGVAQIDDVLTALGDHALPFDDGHVWILESSVRSWAADRVGPTWADDFAGMLKYAAANDWIHPDGEAIRAHLDWEP